MTTQVPDKAEVCREGDPKELRLLGVRGISRASAGEKMGFQDFRKTPGGAA